MQNDYEIPLYINEWLSVIESMSNDNTYKLAWGRAVLECIQINKYSKEDNKIGIKIKDIAKRIISYYWNQVFFFNLKQDPYVDRQSVIIRYVNELIERYINLSESPMPVWSDHGIAFLIEQDKKFYEKQVSKVVTACHTNVAHRFLNVKGKAINLYKYEGRTNECILFEENSILLLKEFYVVLSKLINYRWALLLEQFNLAPNIILKVTGLSNSSLKRKSLSKYKNILLEQFKNDEIVDFYTGEPLDLNDISVDHVIPWSFVYSDDIWNLVLTSKSNNSRKSNLPPSKNDIERLKRRNGELSQIIQDPRIIKDLEYASNNLLVDKLYASMVV